MPDIPSYPGVRIEHPLVETPDGFIAARRYLPSEPPTAGLAWVHGGGFINGDLDQVSAEWVGRVLASRGIAVVSLDYRKALNGLTFPAPSHDVLAGWLWAVDHVESLGVEVDQLHLGGTSAGGNLAASVTLQCRDGAGRLPASLVLVCPLLHAELPPASEELTAVLATSKAMRITPHIAYRVSLNYVGSDALFTDPYAFPASGDVQGLPPTFVLNSEEDDLRSSGEAFGDQLRAAGIPVRVEFEPRAHHGHLDDWTTDEAQHSIDRIVEWLSTTH